MKGYYSDGIKGCRDSILKGFKNKGLECQGYSVRRDSSLEGFMTEGIFF